MSADWLMTFVEDCRTRSQMAALYTLIFPTLAQVVENALNKNSICRANYIYSWAALRYSGVERRTTEEQ